MTAAEVPTRLGSVERQREDEHTDQQGIKPTSHGSTSVTSGAAPKAPRSRHANSPPEARQTNGSHRAGPGRGRPTARPSRPARSGLGRGRTGAESAAGRSGSSRSGLPRDRACRPPANGVEHCETDADQAADAILQRAAGRRPSRSGDPGQRNGNGTSDGTRRQVEDRREMFRPARPLPCSRRSARTHHHHSRHIPHANRESRAPAASSARSAGPAGAGRQPPLRGGPASPEVRAAGRPAAPRLRPRRPRRKRAGCPCFA